MKKVNIKGKKPVLTLAVVVILGISIYMFFGRGSSVVVPPVPTAGSNSPVVSGNRAFPVAEKDALVYSIVDAYMQAQIKNNREELLTLLTEQKQNSWTDSLYLLNETAFRDFDEIKLSDLKLGVITFNRHGDSETAALLAIYGMQFIKDSAVVFEVSLQEELGLMELDGNWLLDYSVRTEASS
jgi:hypothetical protein